MGSCVFSHCKTYVYSSTLQNNETVPILYGKHLPLVIGIKQPITDLFKGLQLDIACDVQNPFLGPNGAVNVFSKQKGATPELQLLLEEGMHRIAEIIHQNTGINLSCIQSEQCIKGAGAAGGIAGSFYALLNATLKRGIVLMAEYVELEKHVQMADLVFSVSGIICGRVSIVLLIFIS